ncbi:head maturation protease, ClpP-related [Clostridium sp.]|uniref:head maturation protease, ClpP-related n=1 Tax=Clostridium sp. TaxID=1506 RepID=UPI002FCB8C5F
MVSKNKFVSIKNQTENSADLYFYGDIVSSWWGAWDDADQYPESIRDFLNEVEGTKNLNIYINSGGGNVFAGMAIYNMLKRHKAHKTVHIDGLAGSIASVIAMAGDKIVIPSNAFLMIHKPWSWTEGNSNDFRKLANDLDAIEEGILNVYAERLREGVDLETIRQMVQEETWINGLEAEKYFNIEVAEENHVAACSSDYFKNYSRVPKDLKNQTSQPKEQEMQESKEEINMKLIELELI